MAFTVEQIIEYLGSDVIANQQTHTEFNQKIIQNIAAIDDATTDDISFVVSPTFETKLVNSSAGAVLITQELSAKCPIGTYPIVVKSPYLSYAKLTALFDKYQSKYEDNTQNLVHPTAIIGNNAQIGSNVHIGAYSQIGDNCVIGNNVVIDAHVNIQPNVSVGEGSVIAPYSFIGHDCVLGKNVTLHSHASIGNEGFGFVPKGKTDEAGWERIHQLGRVVIGDNVRVGSQTCIDRGAINDTVIGDNVIIDNLVQIAHNVQIGAGTAIAACVGIAGSTEIGKRCMIGGAAGFTGHIKICDDVTITGMTMVTKSIFQPGVYSSGLPAMPNNLWKRAFINFKNLAKLQ